MLNAVNLSCQFQETPLFSRLNFELTPGRCLQIIGHNGSGKTTLLRILAGLRWADEGEITWDTHPIATIKAQYAQERLYLGHKPGLKPELTVLENLKLYHALYAHTPNQLNILLEELNLIQQQDLPAHCLSVGQQKRLALTQLQQFNAKLWILDEPFAGLDKTGIAWLQNKIQQHLDKNGMVVFTSHQAINLPAILLELVA